MRKPAVVVRPGRPFRAEAHSTPSIQVRFSPEERQVVVEAARVNHQTTSQFLREAARTAASECLEMNSVVRRSWK